MSASCSSGDGSSSESGEYSTEDENRPKPTVRSGIQLLRDEYSKTNQRNSNERSKYDRQSSYSKSQSQKYSRNSSHSQRSRSNSPIDRSRRNDSDSYRKSKSHRDDYRSSRYSRNSPRRRNYNDEAADSDYERNQNRYSERHYNSSWSRYDDRVKQNDGKRNNWEDDRDRKRNRDKDRDRDRRERNHSPKKRHIERSEDRSSPSRERTDKKQNKKTVEENNRKSPSPTKETSQPRNGEKETQDKDSENKDPNTPAVEESVQQPSVKKSRLEQEENITTRTGGAYIPPARLRMMQAQITDKSSIQYQRIAWEALKKSINGLINKVNVSNIAIIVRELFKENIVRGRGILARSIMQAQAASPTFTHVYAAFTAIINTKFPQIGELVLRRLIIQFRRGFKRNDKNICLSATRFLAHLVNQQVAHEVLALEILTLLLENPTDDSVEVGVGFLKECGMKLTEVSPRGIHAVFERLRSILHEGQLDKRIQYMIEVMFAIRKDNFKDHPAVIEELDMVEEQDQFTHLLTLDEATNPEDILNVFKHDPEYEENEAKYSTLRKEILDESSSGSEGEGEDGDEDGESESEAEEGEEEAKMIIDNTETNLVSLRRTIYLTIQSSLDFEECAHKILKMELKPGQEVELCHMILDCCAQQRTYEKFFGLLAQRFCQLNKIYVTPNEQIFRDSYDTIHRLETNKLRNVAKFFAHLLYTDAIGWIVLSHIRLNEEDTTSSSRIFIKILFQELSEYMGLPRLNERVKDPTLQEAFDGLFPRDNPRNTRFAINFFTSIGLGGLTDELREHLKSQPKQQVVVPPAVESESESSSSSSDDDDDDSEGSDSSSDSESDSSDSDSSSGSDSSVEVIQKKPKEAQYKNKEKKYRGKEKESKSKEKEYRKDDARPSKLHHDKRSKTSHSEHKHKHRSKT